MAKEKYNKDSFNKALAHVRVALSSSEKKGSVLLNCLLLSPEDDHGINEENFTRLIAKFSERRHDQLDLVKEVVNNMRHIRECVLVNLEAREILITTIKEISEGASKSAAIRSFVGGV